MGNLFGGGHKSQPAPMPEPTPPPQPAVIQEDAKKKLRQGASGKSQTIFTSPLGASGEANLGKKDALGA